MKSTKSKYIFFILSLVLLCGIGILVHREKKSEVKAVTANAASKDWGLSFQEEGKSPVIDVSEDELAPLDTFYIGDETKKRLYITFDGGYENGNTEAILDALKKHNVKATFFVVGHYLESCPDIVKRMVEEGHTVGNHTVHHKDMSAMTDKQEFAKELQGVEELYKNITGKEMTKYYRPPQGKFSRESLSMAKELGYKTFFWSLAYVDWDDKKQPDCQQSIEKLCKRVHPGAIVLLHSTSSTNAAIMDELLTRWEDMGYNFGELSEF